jgi:hypothetical protein|tara:strand:+ start:255 stop:446 length:192 start_codon:yes stop_codon:yes gene_type:complete
VDDNLYDLDQIELGELLMIVGSFIFGGNTIDEVDPEIIEKLFELLSIEQTKRLTDVPLYEIIH